ncbi:transmembrane domain-containing protein [Streptomyces sp. NPDC053427]|uniref:transmembrane domain-containing protein n=1 Tax=Streptomyces sp. NPDC053427 TaxID=3365701 RepID=UPI0037D05B51
MSTGTLLAIVIPVAVVLVLIGVAVGLFMRRRHLRERFGPEYDRTVQDADGRMAGERELMAREKRHDALNIKPLEDSRRERYRRDWDGVQQEFVDRPETAVHDADRLVTSLMHERGYPTEDYEQRLKDLSVEHGRTLKHYREAHEIDALTTQHRATTEQLRGAMTHYRALFDELLTNGGQSRHARA